jgi:hypothetical protein
MLKSAYPSCQHSLFDDVIKKSGLERRLSKFQRNLREQRDTTSQIVPWSTSYGWMLQQECNI